MFGIGASRCNDGFKPGLLCCQRVKIGIRLAIGGVHGLQLGLCRKHRAHSGLDALAHGVLWVKLWLLRQVADIEARHRCGLAFDLGVQAGHDFEQGGLARTVGAQHANLGTGEKTERHLFKDVALGRHDFADLVHGKDVLGHRKHSLDK